jgi:hypothetical protein
LNGGTYQDRHFRYVIVTDVTDAGDGSKLDCEWVKDGEVTKYRPALPRETVETLARLDHWKRVGE